MKQFFTLIFCASSFFSVFAQSPTLVKDIAAGTGLYTRVEPQECIALNNVLYFIGRDPSNNGRDLWISDGTAAGTKQLTSNLFPLNLTRCGNQLYFMGFSTSTGYELFRYDINTNKAILVKDCIPGPNSSEPSNLTVGSGNILYFTAGSLKLQRRELWVTDGTNTSKLTSFEQGNDNFYQSPEKLSFCNGNLYFSAGTSATGRELWKSDGTVAGTALLKDIRTGVGSAEPTGMTAYNGKVYFNSLDNSDTVGYELWVTDGTAAGTMLFKDVKPKPGFNNQISSDPKDFTVLNNTLYFTAIDSSFFGGRGLWKTDGTAANTVKLHSGSNAGNLSIVNDSIYYTDGSALMKSDGSIPGTQLIKNFSFQSQGPRFITTIGDITYFVADTNKDNANNYEVWRTNGTAAGTARVIDLRPGRLSSFPKALCAVNSTLFFAGDNGINGISLYNSDGTSAGTKAISQADIGINTIIGKGTALGNRLLFNVTDAEHGNELWSSDGKAEGTALVKDILSGAAGSKPSWLTPINGTAFFNADEELWRTDGTSGGTSRLSNLFFADNPTSLTAVGNTLYFNAAGSDKDTLRGYELWKSDGTIAGTKQVKDIAPKSNESYPRFLLNHNGTLFFTADDNTHGRELWKSDGTAAGTKMVKDINPNSFDNYDTLISVNGSVLFSTYSGQWVLWKSDGTDAGTTPLKSLGTAAPFHYVVMDDILYFLIYDSFSQSYILCKSDGTVSGTVVVKSLGTFGRKQTDKLFAFNHQLYFAASDSLHGNELWTSDGTPAGTKLFKDINPGIADAYPESFAANENNLYFSAGTDSTGKELWLSDGTEAGTKQAAELVTGLGSSNPKQLTFVQENLYFIASTPDKGNELWRLFTGCMEVDFSLSTLKACQKDTITLTATVNTFGQDESGLMYQWNVGNGQIISSGDPKIIRVLYPSGGTKTISLQVINGSCASPIITKKLLLITQPLAAFNTPNSIQCKKNNNFNFTSTSSGDAPLSYQWFFGDNQTASTANTSHSYANAGTYAVKLLVASDGLCYSDTARQNVTVNPNPALPAINGPSTSFKNAIDTFSVTKIAGSTYAWTITGGTLLSGSPTHTIAVRWGTGSSGTVRVVESSDKACTSEAATKGVALQGTGIGTIGNGEISFYPNPLMGNEKTLHLQATNLESGLYQFRILNPLGQAVWNESIAINGAIYSKEMILNIPPGMYLVELIDTRNQLFQQKLMIY